MRLKEDSELIKFFDWIRWNEKQDPRLSVVFHVENERRTSFAAGKRRKLKGVRAGVPDIVAPIPTEAYPGLFIELKIKPNKLTEHQTRVCTALHGLGYCVRVAYSGMEAIAILKEYLNE